MSGGRQVADGFYLKRSRSRRPPLASQLEGLFDNLLLDFELRLTCKIFDVHRTLTALSSEVRRSVLIEDVSELVFERGVKAAMDGSADFVVRTMHQLTRIVPPHSVVRKHYAKKIFLRPGWHYFACSLFMNLGQTLFCNTFYKTGAYENAF